MSSFPFLIETDFEERDKGLLTDLNNGKFENLLCSECVSFLLSEEPSQKDLHQASPIDRGWAESVRSKVASYAGEERHDAKARSQRLLLVGLAALYAFLQANVTGPPLDWDPAEVCLCNINDTYRTKTGRALVLDLSADGEAVYRLTPHIELFSLAKIILDHLSVYLLETPFAWAKLRVDFIHQQLLNEISPSLLGLIYQGISFLDHSVLGSTSTCNSDVKVLYLLERAAINTFHGLDKRAREDLSQATRVRKFQYVLTGRLGKRTKFQQSDVSQLVVLAKSKVNGDYEKPDQGVADQSVTLQSSRPQNLDLDDDTLLETISFSKGSQDIDSAATEKVTAELDSLDPSTQPTLDPLDSIILLSLASSITNTSPQHGLTREETLPYASRVLESGSTNWQIYTQALLVRSRIEGYRSRTVERGVLQLQALVDQVIAQTTENTKSEGSSSESTSTFLPKPKESESAPVSERLQYIFQLASPFTWTLEAELASRWVALGGLRTALEIFERLEMWAETALCWAATDGEDKARRIVRRQLYRSNVVSLQATDGEGESVEEYLGDEISPLPTDAPRLFCILGDFEKEPKHYERAWEISNKRYARAQRSLGKYYLSVRDLQKADGAYSKSLAINPQNAATWFSLGCVRLETMDWKGAVLAFTRSVQIEDEDAEAWSNLAAALLRLPVEQSAPESSGIDDEEHAAKEVDPQKHRKEAFVALKKATSLKRDSYRIWQNLLNVGATISPPPYAEIIVAQQRLIELQNKTEGESCVDIEVLEGILSHVIAIGFSATSNDNGAYKESPRKRYGLENMLSDLVQKQVVPLITQSRRLWQLVARLAIHQNRPSSALDAYEKAWRTTLNKPGWDDGSSLTGSSMGQTETAPTKTAWEEVVDSTVELVDAYESLGEKEITEGLGAGSRELVCKNWKYKARMALRSVIGRRTKAGFEDVGILKEKMENLKS